MAEEEEKPQEECKETKCKCPAGAPAWMVTYSDLVTLLLTFFVLLLSMASMDPRKFLSATTSIKDAFGLHKTSTHMDFNIPILPPVPDTKFTPVQQELTVKMFERIKAELEKLETGESIEAIMKDSDTILLRVKDSILFKPGQSKITTIAYSSLRNIANIVRPLPMTMRIEGHTDSTPVSNLPIDNWNLSMDRATSVLRFFTKSDLLPLDRMAAVGYGPDRPVADNETAEGKAQNRRVDFVLRLNTEKDRSTGQALPGRIPL